MHANATRIIKKERIILKNNIKPITLVTLIFTLVEATDLLTQEKHFLSYTYSSVPHRRHPAY